jgi:predicted acylesterase/phospholipase RssA
MRDARDLGITFAGGGTSSFYQLGLMNCWAEKLMPRVGAFATVSAGACVAAIALSGRQEEVADLWRARSRGITRNFDWRLLLRGRRPNPHESIYRALLMHAFAEGGFDRLRALNFPFFVLTTSFPRAMPAALAAAWALALHGAERVAGGESVHSNFSRKPGFAALVFDARECASPAELADLIIASSATPPFTSVGSFAGWRLLDGGLIDNAPAFLMDRVPEVRRNLVLLTRHRRPDARRNGSHSQSGDGELMSLGNGLNRLYVSPSEPLPLSTWDYTRPEAIFDIVALGERDAEEYGAELSEFLDTPARDEKKETSPQSV